MIKKMINLCILTIFLWILSSSCAHNQYQGKMYPMNVHKSHNQKKSIKISQKNYKIFTDQKRSAKLETIINALKNADVVFLGEMHNDPVAHYLEKQILKKAYDRYYRKAYPSKRKQIILSLEMFERDVQMVLDEYLFDIIDERHFLACSRPWNNYLMDYHPLIKFAKKNNIRVIAANAPRRYVHRVAQYGMKSLNDLSATAKTWIAPIPYQKPSNKLKKRFKQFQKKASHVHNHELSKKSHFLEAQNLWDATMAYSLNEELTHTKKSLLIHLNGFFHSQSGVGVPEHLMHYRPDTRIMTITMIQSAKFPEFDASFEEYGDFIIITEPIK